MDKLEKIDPLRLTTEEINYELNIRNCLNVANPRAKISKLKEFFRNEQAGTAKPPKESLRYASSESEITTCCCIYEELIKIAQ